MMSEYLDRSDHKIYRKKSKSKIVHNYRRSVPKISLVTSDIPSCGGISDLLFFNGNDYILLQIWKVFNEYLLLCVTYYIGT